MEQLVPNAIIWFIPVLLSLTVHEWAHAATAHALGDDTAARLGRMTFNPIPHIDPLGTLILPLLQLVGTGMVMFAWAKPVPVSPVNFDRRITVRKGQVLVSAAGPASNIAIAILVALAMGILLRLEVRSEPAFFLLQSLFGLNVALAIFNLLPIPPLDGSHVLRGLLPTRSAALYERIFPYAPVLLLGVLFFGRGIIAWPMIVVQGWLWNITGLVAGLGT